MTPSNARKLANQTQPAVLTLRRTFEVLKGETDPLLIFIRDNIEDALKKVKNSIASLNGFEGGN